MFITKILIDSCIIRQNIKRKKHFCRYCLQHFSKDEILVKRMKICSEINSKQHLKLRNAEIDSTNYNRKLTSPFKAYADFQCILKEIQSVNGDNFANISHTDKYQKHIP